MIIRKPTQADLPGLCALWQEAFGDSREEVESFYETAFSYDRALLAEAQNPVGGIYWIDAQIGGQKVAYLYAFAVDKECRGRGMGKALLEETMKTLKGEGYAAAVLVPGEASLQTYYEKMGFSVFGKTRSATAEAPGIPVKKVSAETYMAKRQTLNPPLQWPKSALVYLEQLSELYAGEDWVLAVGREGVQEYVGPWEHLPHILFTLQPTAGATPAVAMVCCFAPVDLPEVFGPFF